MLGKINLFKQLCTLVDLQYGSICNPFLGIHLFFSSKGCFILNYPFPTVPYQLLSTICFIKAYLTRGSLIRITRPIFF